MSSYLHCPACGRAYNVTREVSCPSCRHRPGGAPEDPTEDVVTAAEQLARALARATPAQLAAAESALADRPALPAPERTTTTTAAAPSLTPLSVLRAIRTTLAPPPLPVHVVLLATMTLALLRSARGVWRYFPKR